MAKTRRLSANRLLLELIENGIEAKNSRNSLHWPSVSAAKAIRKQSVSATNWVECYSAVNAQDRELGSLSCRRPPALDRPDARPGDHHLRPRPALSLDRLNARSTRGDWCKDFGSFKMCGRGHFGKRGQAAKEEGSD
jgi:hypothetical protein